MANKYKKLLIVCVGYIIITIIFAISIKSSLHLMMAFNMFLALIPFVISLKLKNKQNIKPVFFWIIFIVWLLFIPNTFYFLTDLIHISKLDIYSYLYVEGESIIIYEENIIEWLKVIHLTLGALGGMVLGLASLYEMHQMLIARKQKFPLIYLGAIFLLSGLAIYIGRFLRFNSWDIFNLIRLIKTLWESFNIFALLFTLLFSFIIFILYYIYYHLCEDKLTKHDNIA